jgi:hypothetical protein
LRPAGLSAARSQHWLQPSLRRSLVGSLQSSHWRILQFVVSVLWRQCSVSSLGGVAGWRVWFWLLFWVLGSRFWVLIVCLVLVFKFVAVAGVSGSVPVDIFEFLRRKKSLEEL